MIKTNVLNYIENCEDFYAKKEKEGEMTEEYKEELKRIEKLKVELEWLFSEF